MHLRNWILAAALISLSSPALATVKVYDASADNGTAGEGFSYSTTQCPPIDVDQNTIQGAHTIEDNGLGTVTLTAFELSHIVESNYGPEAIESVFGPGAFVFVSATPTNNIAGLPVTSPGSTTSSIAWGVVAGFTKTGIAFCIASPQTICTGGAMVPHGQTSPLGPINSPTYDLGTWSFDAAGDLSASQYIHRTNNGGTSNGQRLVRGAYVGSSIPALPLIGAAALALGLVVAGSRSVLRKK